MRGFTAIDLFAGAGGASEGLSQAGISIISANEINHDAALTYRFNHPDTTLVEKDVQKVAGKELLNGHKSADMLFAGLPCQGFSNAGKKDKKDSRNYLFRHVVKIASEIKPRYVLIENVAGLLAQRNHVFLTSIEKNLNKIGYNVSYKLFDTSECGVPQKRNRLLILASEDSEITLNDFRPKRHNKISVRMAIGDLRFLSSGSSVEYEVMPKTAYQKRMRGSQKELWNHETSSHSRTVSRRFGLLKEGEVMRTAMPKVRTRKRYAIKLNGMRPAPTITTMPDDYIHYSLPRTLTVREMARLQSFHDSYIFLGPRTTGGRQRRGSAPQYTQVGNAVPPLFMKATGAWLLSR